MTSWTDLVQNYGRDDAHVTESEAEMDGLRGDGQGDVVTRETERFNYFEVAGMFVGISGVVGQIILSHPWIVIRRQCQIRHDCYKCHWTPFTVLPVVIKLVNSQGPSTLWKGINSTLCLYLIGITSESVLSQVCNLPKDVSKHSSLKKIGQHILLKGISLIILSPFYAASLVETVQSDLSSDPTTLVSCLLEGCRRMVTFQREPVSRLLPIWKIFPVVAAYGVFHYVIKTTTSLITYSYLSPNDIELSTNDESEIKLDDRYYSYYCDIFSSVMSCCMADLIMYPFEVIVNRLCIQGTRVLIDNMDNPYELVPINTAYYGLHHAINTILNEKELGEGAGGLYKGFGALILQYGILFFMIFCMRLGFENLLVHHSSSFGQKSFGSPNRESLQKNETKKYRR